MRKKRDALQREVAKALKKTENNRVLLGLSGGADSTALLRLLKSCQADIYAVHCNFQLRGEESNRDMEFCRDLCQRMNVRIEVVEFDVAGYMEDRGMTSVEEACRELRYDYFRKKGEEIGASRIAVAHNADDNIETLLLNLLRGSGLKGLKGMQMDSNGILRPLITISRKEILAYLDEINQDYITDSSNLENEYRRNFLRNEVIPLIESRWPGARKAISTTISNLQSDYAGLEYLKRTQLQGIEHGELRYEELKKIRNPEWLIYEWVKQYGGKHNISYEITEALGNDGETIAGKRWLTPKGTIHATRAGLIFVANIDSKEAKELQIDEYFEVTEYENNLETRRQIRETGGNDELWTTQPVELCELRRAKEGDRIDSLGIEGSQLVSKVMKDGHVAAYKRKDVILVETEGKILWIPGLRRSRHYLVEAGSEKIYKWSPRFAQTTIKSTKKR